MRFFFRPLLFAFCLVNIFSCNTTKKTINSQRPTGIKALRFLSEYDVPYNMPFNQTTVGGLSGIDFDKGNDCYYLICDDRSAINAARFYTAKIFISSAKIDSVRFTNVTELLQPGGHPYPNSSVDPYHTPDPEALRYDPFRKQMTWSSEGERILKTKDTVLEDPAINVITPGGKFIDSFPLPSLFAMQKILKGPRQNGVLEGLTFADDYQSLYANVEEPLFEDGPRADIVENNAFIRILKFDVNSKRNTRQYAYRLDPVAYPASPVDAFKINGIPDILYIGNKRLLVIERSFSTGHLPCTIKVFISNLAKATDVKNIASLKDVPAFTPLTKTLLLNMDDLGIYIDNIEGVTFGPMLPNGHKTLLFVSDNNFSEKQKTQ